MHKSIESAEARRASPYMAGARASAGVGIAVAVYGLAFGILARQGGLSLAEGGLMSGLVFAGASQFVALDMWGPSMSLGVVVLTTFVVNLRHVLMGASGSAWFAECGRAKALLAYFVMIDESWAMTAASKVPMRDRAAFLIGSGVLLYLCWNLSTLAGFLLVPEMDDPARWGLDFVFCAAFLALLAGMYRGRGDIPAWIVAALAAVAASAWLPGKWYILVGGVAGGIMEAVKHGRRA